MSKRTGVGERAQKVDRRTRLDQLAGYSVMTDKQLADILPTLPLFERIEILIAKYVGGNVSRSYDGERPTPKCDAEIGYHLARKIKPWLSASPIQGSASDPQIDLPESADPSSDRSASASAAQASALAEAQEEIARLQDRHGTLQGVAVLRRERAERAEQSLREKDAEIARLTKNLMALVDAESGYRQSERLALRQLSDALTGGNASTWDEVFHAAESISASAERERTLREALKAVTDHMDRAGGDGYGMPECPWCKAGPSGDDHRLGCELAAARELISALPAQGGSASADAPAQKN